MNARLLATLLLLATCGSTHADDRPYLRSPINVTGSEVKFGDLAGNAGDKADTPLFRSPELGKTGTLRAETVARAARDLGIMDIDLRGLSTVTVQRPARQVMLGELKALTKSALAKLDASLADANVTFDTEPGSFDAPRNVEMMARVADFDMESGRFRIEILGDGIALPIAGIAESRALVMVLVRSVGRGDVVNASDIVVEARPRRGLPANPLLDPARLTQMVAKNSLRSGQILREEDLGERDLVDKNQKVTVNYQSPGLSLTMVGKALSSGPRGATVQIQNPSSKRSFDAVVTGLGTVNAKVN